MGAKGHLKELQQVNIKLRNSSIVLALGRIMSFTQGLI